MRKLFVLFLFVSQLNAQQFTAAEISQWEKQAQDVTISRDRWGIPHVEGKTDADAVFGLIYAQCEDDFPRVELNYIEKLGRLSEIEGDRITLSSRPKESVLSLGNWKEVRSKGGSGEGSPSIQHNWKSRSRIRMKTWNRIGNKGDNCGSRSRGDCSRRIDCSRVDRSRYGRGMEVTNEDIESMTR